MRITLFAAQAALIVSAGLAALPAQAQTPQAPQTLERRQIAPNYPNKTIRVMTTVTPGGGLDIITRAITAKLGERLPQAIIVDNVSGANGVIAVNTLFSAPADGHTVLSGGGSIPINSVFKRFSADVRTALTPVADMSFQPYMVFVPASSPINSFPDLIAYAKKNPGKLNYGSSGLGSVVHMGSELIEYMAGVDMVHVAYKGTGGSHIDLAAGRLDLLLGSISALQLVRTGKAKLLAVTAPQRLPDYPDKPAVAEYLPGYELFNSYFLSVRAETPDAIVNALNKEVIQALTDPDLRKRIMADASNPAPPRPPGELKKRLRDEIDRWEAVVKKANIKLEE
jgi:tripartite-type tricarboxylate transporter receptor subunit TctC